MNLIALSLKKRKRKKKMSLNLIKQFSTPICTLFRNGLGLKSSRRELTRIFGAVFSFEAELHKSRNLLCIFNIALRNNNFTIDFIASFMFLFLQSTFFIFLYRKNRYKNSLAWFHQVHKFYFQFRLFIVDFFSYLRICLVCSLYGYCSKYQYLLTCQLFVYIWAICLLRHN